MKRATFTITPELLEWLKTHSEQTGLTKSDIVRRALEAYRAQQEDKKK